jgi:tellurite resistance protein
MSSLHLTRTKQPLNLFGIPFGLVGLASMWTEAAELRHLPTAIPDVLWVITAVVWVVTLLRYLLRAGSPAAVLADLRDPVLGPFAALVPVVATLFGERLHAENADLGKVWVLVTASISFAFAAWFLSHLATQEREIDQLHSGYLLPTVASGLISAQSLSAVGYHMLGLAAFGSGMVFWLLISAVYLYRLSFRPQAPAGLVPTYAIFSAPPAVAGNAWFAITAIHGGEHVDIVQDLLFGVFLLLIAFQVMLVPTYLRLPFTLGFWALTFTTVASGRYGIRLIADTGVAGGAVWEWLVIAVATGIVAAVTAASLPFGVRALKAARTPVPAVPAAEPVGASASHRG